MQRGRMIALTDLVVMQVETNFMLDGFSEPGRTTRLS